ncbi:hypothetical protein AMJ52_06025 [candidate division TA06 bacterium DG_78]|uniref:Uncharacterized protein n=1 Tax=candidate division TA06 bacterium DG_78 TaxID=1703772 RepID=A0A0S7YEJ0_UNCT6|nr:MAG: hypothetical protein AMJ52_06025 [candidate division TA06 bacterium DG_78]
MSKKSNYLISVPHKIADFLKSFSFLAGLQNRGTCVILMPKFLETIYGLMKQNIFKVMFYDKLPLLFSRDHKMLKKQLEHEQFHYLVELNIPANISLPYLTSAEKRICLCDKNNFPYYNILIREGFTTLNGFFEIKDSNPQNLFHFNANRVKTMKRKLGKKRPLLFVNRHDDIEWEGIKVIVGKDIQNVDAEAYEMLYLADAYYGVHDELYEFATIFNKEIISHKK